MSIEAVMSAAPVIPVIVVQEVDQAVPLARALVAGGITSLEVTLRTPAGLEAIRAIAGEVEGAVVGAGTVLSPADVKRSAAAGARFLVSPGTTPALLDTMVGSGLDLLPGISSPAELMGLLERGLDHAKLFPASAVGGTAMLRALAGPFPGVRFCPTGGITEASAPDWLAIDPVLCVGGSWVVPAGPLDCARTEALAREAAALRG